MGEIRFDFQMARQQGQRLSGIAAKLEQTIRGPYTEAMQELKEGWQSDGSRKFMEKEAILEGKMLGSAALIRQAKDALYRAYERAEYAEEKAKEIAEKRREDK